MPFLIRITALVLALICGPQIGSAESYASIQERRPELFHPTTGFRIDRQRAPTPDDVPAPVKKVSPTEAKDLVGQGAIALDVFGALQSRYDELDGTWLVSEQRQSLPGAVWLPEVGRGVLDETMQRYLQEELIHLTKNDVTKEIVVFCVADCWMSWNASQRIAALGYTRVFWFRLGTDGWLDNGWSLSPVDPVPVNVD